MLTQQLQAQHVIKGQQHQLQEQLQHNENVHLPDDSAQPHFGHAPLSSAPAIIANGGTTTSVAVTGNGVCGIVIKLPPFWAVK